MTDAGPPRPGSERSWWLREALAAEGEALRAPALSGRVDADVAIVGGGYTGMWAAWFLAERAPDARIVLMEQDICGGGPSGRNGGFVHGWWENVPELARRYGPDAALETARAADEVVSGIGAWCAANAIDAWHVPAGYLRVNAFGREPSHWDATVAMLRERGAGDELEPRTAAEVRAVCASPTFRDGLFMRTAASIQPALLARGLRRRLIERGVRICEGTRVRGIETGSASVTVAADGGSVHAQQAILGLNAWAAGWPGFRLRTLSWGSYMVMTEPIPDRLAELGWTGGELISDSRFTISYFRTTRDGRIAFGAGVGAAGFDGRIGETFTHDSNAVTRVVANFRHLFPMLEDVRFEAAWGGPIDITADRFPEIGSRGGGRVHYAHGFAGNGAGPSRLAGRILAALVDDPADPLARLPIVGHRQRPFPPEPLRFVGARLVREALIRQDDALDAGRRPSWAVRALARLPRLLGYRLGH
jgi:glycine/D-amino acid oxidase-like deaminating enzyme